MKNGPLELYLQRCQQEHEKQQQANQQLGSLQKQIEATEYRLENLLNALADDLLPLEAINRNTVEKRSRNDNWNIRYQN